MATVIFELAQDFYDAVAAMPKEQPKQRMLELLEEAIRRDIHFIVRHPTTPFQCMWNNRWRYAGPRRPTFRARLASQAQSFCRARATS